MDSLLAALTVRFLGSLPPGRARTLLEAGTETVSPLLQTLPPRARERAISGEARREAQLELERAGRAGVLLVPFGHPDYPAWLARTADPPPVLWVRGRLVPGEGPLALAIVGSRAASTAGRALARSLAFDLSRAGLTIVSGLARGIDGEAHQGALRAQARTVAVLGSGLDRMYPPEHAALAGEILRQGGAVVSEQPLGTRPAKESFPRRNRILAGWTCGTVVVEAAERSGALVTARCALEEGREVLAVPGHPSRPEWGGTNALIRDGAALVRSSADVASELGLELRAAEPEDQDPVLEGLSSDAPRSLEELQARVRRPLPELLSRLLELELVGRVRRLPGPRFVRQIAIS